MARMIAPGIRKLPRPTDTSVCLPPCFKRCQLSVVEKDRVRLLPISAAVAEILIARGMPYQG